MALRNTLQNRATKKRVTAATKLICSNPGCSHRGEPQPELNFYKTNTETMNRYSICKSCVSNMINAEDLTTVYPVLRDLNIAFVPQIWFENAARSGKVGAFGKYLKALNLGNRGALWNDSQKITPEDERTLLEQVTEKFANSDAKKRAEAKLNEVTPEMITLWGHGWVEDDYILLQTLYDELKVSYPAATSLHVTALKTFVIANVKYTKASQTSDTNEAAKWYNIMKDAGDKAKINPKQLTKADLQGGLNSFSELIQAVEVAIDVIPILPKYTRLPRDLPDFVLWSIVSNMCAALGRPEPSYPDVYQYWDLKMAAYLRETGDPEGLFDFANTDEMRAKMADFIDLDK